MKKISIIILQLVAIASVLGAQDIDLAGAFSDLSGSADSSAIPVPGAPEAVAVSETAQPKASYKWLVLVFLTGTNDLGILNYAAKDVNEMEKVGSTDKVAVVVEYNTLTQNGGDLQFQRGAKTLFITKDNDINAINSTVIDPNQPGDMGSWKHLSIFARKNIARFKPEKVMLIVWNHGSGRLGIAFDDVSKNHMEVNQLGMALKQIGRRIDIFATDACLMQMASVVHELKDSADVILGSQEVIPGPGFPYDDLIGILDSNDSADGAASAFVDAYYAAYQNGKAGGYAIGNKKHTLSAIKAGKAASFSKDLSDWAEAAMAKEEDFATISSETYTESAFYFGSSGLAEAGLRSVDLVDYLSSVKDRIKDESLKEKTEKAISSAKGMIINSKAGNGTNKQGLNYNAHTNGVSIYLPLLRYNANNYEKMSFTKDTKWDDFLRKLLSRRGN